MSPRHLQPHGKKLDSFRGCFVRFGGVVGGVVGRCWERVWEVVERMLKGL